MARYPSRMETVGKPLIPALLISVITLPLPAFWMQIFRDRLVNDSLTSHSKNDWTMLRIIFGMMAAIFSENTEQRNRP